MDTETAGFQDILEALKTPNPQTQARIESIANHVEYILAKSERNFSERGLWLYAVNQASKTYPATLNDLLDNAGKALHFRHNKMDAHPIDLSGDDTRTGRKLRGFSAIGGALSAAFVAASYNQEPALVNLYVMPVTILFGMAGYLHFDLGRSAKRLGIVENEINALENEDPSSPVHALTDALLETKKAPEAWHNLIGMEANPNALP